MDKEEIKEKVTHVKEKLDEVKENVADAAARSKEKAKEIYGSMRDKLADQDWEKVKESTKTYIKNNPEKAVGAALVVGFFIGYLVRRKGD